MTRLFHGLTQRELAERVAVSNGLIAAFENDDKQPGDEIFAALSAALDVDPSFLEGLRTDEFTENDSNFRKRITASEKLKRQVRAQASMYGIAVRHLARYGQLPPRDFPDMSAETAEQIESIAEACRNHWNYGIDAPIIDMTSVAENAGAVILSVDLDTAKKVDAFSCYGEVSVIVLNSEKDSPSRTRFDLAHEIGHGVLHQRTNGMPLDRKEEQADQFASAFLLPREAFIADFMANRSLDWEGLLDMKAYWQVSVQAIIRRAHQLGLIDAAEYRTRFRKLSYWGWRTEEPGEPERDQPILFREALARAHRDYGKTPAILAREIGWSHAVFEKVTGVAVPTAVIGKVISLDERRRAAGNA